METHSSANPLIVTDKYVDDGEIVYGEYKSGDQAKAAKARLKELPVDFTLLDREVDRIVWTLANLFPGCLMKAVDGIRAKKKFFWDQAKLPNRHWLMANMNYEAFPGFRRFQHQENYRLGHRGFSGMAAANRGRRSGRRRDLCQGHAQAQGMIR